MPVLTRSMTRKIAEAEAAAAAGASSDSSSGGTSSKSQTRGPHTKKTKAREGRVRRQLKETKIGQSSMLSYPMLGPVLILHQNLQPKTTHPRPRRQPPRVRDIVAGGRGEREVSKKMTRKMQNRTMSAGMCERGLESSKRMTDGIPMMARRHKTRRLLCATRNLNQL